MKIFIRGAAAALALSLVGMTGADAQITHTAGHGDGNCTTAMFFSFVTSAPSNIYCIGNYAGNNEGGGEAFALSEINSAWGGLGVSVTDGKTIQQGGSDGQISHTGGSTGTISFTNPFTGDFVFAMKAGPTWSAYLFQGVTDLSSFGYETYDPNQDLSHFTYYDNGISVPEPTTLFLLGTGLLGMSMLGWRRREEILA